MLPSEFEKQIRKIGLNPQIEKEILDAFNNVGDENPCLGCASKDSCENFKWHKKNFKTENCPK